jgi:plastocyanin
MKSLQKTVALSLVLVACACPALSQQHIVNAFCCAFQDPANGNSNVSIVPVGTTVKWVRTDFFPHTVTNGTGGGDPNAGLIFNGNLAGAATMFTFTFNTIGTYPYYCVFHEFMNMNGTVHVLPAASSTTVGTGCASSTGVLSLATTALPKINTPTFGFTLSGGPSGAQGFLFISTGIAPAPLDVGNGCLAYLELTSLLALMSQGVTPTGPQLLSAGGTTTFTFPIPNNPGFGGIAASAQGLVFDATVPGGFALSNAVSIVVGA